MPYCVSCGADFSGIPVFRATLCPECDACLHSCVHCKFYAPTAHNQCLEPQSEYVPDREKANFCDYFKVAGAGDSTGDRASTAAPSADDLKERAVKARAKLEALFKPPGDDSE